MIVNIKYDLVQCKQINRACRIHLLNRKKILVQQLQQQFLTCKIVQQYKLSMHIKSCLSLMTEAIHKQMETTQSKSISKICIYTGISQKDRQKNHAGVLADNGNLLQIWMKHSLIQWISVNSYHTFHMMCK